MMRPNKLVIWGSVVYIVAICGYMILHRIWFSPDQFFIFALFGSLIIGRASLFLIDWGPFLSLFLGYEFLRGLVPFVSSRVHFLPMIHVDERIFGFIPTVQFQSWLYTPAHLHWYDYLAVTLYICHFVTPMLVGFIFWLKDRDFFKSYTSALLILSYAAFITYIIYPAAPPWLAASQGYLPPVEEVTGVVMSHFPQTHFSLPSVYFFLRSNPVAAMPSLHAAFPVMIMLYLFKKSRFVGTLFIPYVLGVWFAVMYLGEHYFVDIIFGTLYAVVVFTILNFGIASRIHSFVGSRFAPKPLPAT